MFNFHQWTVAKKMVLTGAVLLVMLVAICSLAVLSLSRAQRNFDNFVSDDFSRGGLARDVRAATSARAISARNLILLNGPEDVKAETIAVKAAHDRVQERLGMLKSAVEKSKDVTPQERELLSRIVALESQYGPVALDIVAMALAGDKQGATEKMNAECQPLLKKLIATTTDYSRLITASGAAEIKRSTEEFMAQRLLLTSSSVAEILIAAGLGVLIHKSLARSLGADPIALRAAAKRVAYQTGVSVSTLRRVERGDPSVALPLVMCGALRLGLLHEFNRLLDSRMPALSHASGLRPAAE